MKEAQKYPFLTTKSKGFIELMKRWGYSNSITTLLWGGEDTSFEFKHFLGNKAYKERRAIEELQMTPSHSDLLVVAGPVTYKQVPYLIQIFKEMPEPRFVIALGTEASSGGLFDTYSVVQGLDKILPVDVFIPGNPPHPDAMAKGIEKIIERIRFGALKTRGSLNVKN